MNDPERTIREMVHRVRCLLHECADLASGEKVVLAVSGGIDSMVMLDIMARLQQPLDLRLHVAHLDHQLRPLSAADSEFVRDEARRRGLSFVH